MRYSKSLRRRQKQRLNHICKLIRAKGLNSIESLSIRQAYETEEIAIALLKIGVPVEEVAWLSRINKHKLVEALEDIHKGHL